MKFCLLVEGACCNLLLLLLFVHICQGKSYWQFTFDKLRGWIKSQILLIFWEKENCPWCHQNYSDLYQTLQSCKTWVSWQGCFISYFGQFCCFIFLNQIKSGSRKRPYFIMRIFDKPGVLAIQTLKTKTRISHFESNGANSALIGLSGEKIPKIKFILFS